MAFTKTAGVNYGTPAVVLSTTAAEGSNQTAIRTDGQIIAFSTDVPEDIAYGQSAATGSDAVAARLDHDHGMAASDAVSAASQAEMVAASSTTVYASPGRTQFHPGVAKAWAKAETPGTSFYASYGFTSVSKPATGRRTFTLSTAMSSANWCAVTDVNATGSGVYSQVDVTSTTTVDTYTFNTSHAAFDASVLVACWGEQV